MKKTTVKFLSLICIFSLLLSIFLTGCDGKKNPDDGNSEGDMSDGGNGTDNGNDGSTDNKKEMLSLVENGIAKFDIVYNFYMAGDDLRNAIIKFHKNFMVNGVKVKLLNIRDTSNINDCEIIIGGSVEKYRPGYELDTVLLGNEGYGVAVKDKKILIKGNTQKGTIEALNWFSEKYLKLSEEETDIKNLKVEKDLKTEIKQDFNVDKISIDGIDLNNYKIKYDKNDSYAEKAAEILHNRIYDISGYWLDYSFDEELTDHCIYIKNSEDCKEYIYKVSVKDGSMYIECKFPKLIESMTGKFSDEYFDENNKGNLEFNSTFFYGEKLSETISYCEFGGAKGDGITDDYDAIKKTHERANITGQKVIAESGKTFNMGQHDLPIDIKTDTDWTAAYFIIDDTEVLPNSMCKANHVFRIASDKEPVNIKNIKGLHIGDTNIGITFERPYLLNVVNSKKKQYIRYGKNHNSGYSMQQIILVDKEGNIDPSTPVFWDFDEITDITAYSADDKPIKITGGIFTTKANQTDNAHSYYFRGIEINRSNTVISDIKHYVRGEGDSGSPYYGFISTKFCNNILVENALLTGHKTYQCIKDTGVVNMGTYDILCASSNNVTFRNVTQTNNINDKTYWGIMASNYSSNLTMDNCKLSRFDAHCGVLNANILNSELSFINAIGGGLFRIENTTVYSNTVVNLRGDYGSTWRGDIVMKNIRVANSGDINLVSASWKNHYFGYKCYLPRSITAEGITISDKNKQIQVIKFNTNNKEFNLDVFSNGEKNNNPYAIPEKITIKNSNSSKIIVSNNSVLNQIPREIA